MVPTQAGAAQWHVQGPDLGEETDLGLQVDKWEPCGLVTAAVKGRCAPWRLLFIYCQDSGATLMGGGAVRDPWGAVRGVPKEAQGSMGCCAWFPQGSSGVQCLFSLAAHWTASQTSPEPRAGDLRETEVVEEVWWVHVTSQLRGCTASPLPAEPHSWPRV